MCTNWKRFTLKAIILASLSLFLYGCGGGGTPEAPVLKEVRGVVADSATGQAFANATVTAYSIDAAGNVAATPLSAAVQSDGQGNFVLMIPAAYAGGIMLKATENGSTVIRAVLPPVAQGQPAVISLATEMVVEYVETNKAGSFTSVNIQKAILVLEPFFGPNFTQITPPASGSTTTPAQQQLLVVTQAVNSLLESGSTITGLVTINPASGIIRLGEGTVFTSLNAAIAIASTNLINAGVIPGSFTLPVIIPVPEPDLSDVTVPSAPQNLAATSNTSSVTLSWGAATDDVGVTAYYIYRDGVFIGSVASSVLTFSDTSVNSGITYRYDVRARDAAGNISTASTINIATVPILTYTITGKVTSGTSGLASVFLIISGSGTGVFVTDADGNYSVTGVRAGNYTVTPVLSGYAFTPTSRPVEVSTANITGVDFAAEKVITGTVGGGVTFPSGVVIGGVTYPSGVVIGGVTYPLGTLTGGITLPSSSITAQIHFGAFGRVVDSVSLLGISGVTVTALDASSNATVTTTDSAGLFNFNNLANGTYTITVTPVTGFTSANPASSSITIADSITFVNVGVIALVP
jgi:hypothetical protein